jgi:hypothetical protein
LILKALKPPWKPAIGWAPVLLVIVLVTAAIVARAIYWRVHEHIQ